MGSFPTDNFTSPDHTNHPSLPPTPRFLESLNEGAPTSLDDLFSNYRMGFNVDAGAAPTPRGPPHGTFPRHPKPLVQRRLTNIHRKRHGRPSVNPKRSPIQNVGFNAPPLTNYDPADPLNGEFSLNTHPSVSPSAACPSSTTFDRDVPQCHMESDVLVPQASPQLNTLQHSNPHAALVPQLRVDVCNNMSHAITHPSASCPSGSSSAAFENAEVERPSFSGTQNFPISMTLGQAPPGLAAAAATASSSLTWIPPIMPTTADQVIRAWDAGTATIPALNSTAPAREEQPRVPISRCTCCKRVHPLVRVEDTIEWVRPDVMKMVLYFNWSSNADAEAHGPWEP